MTTLRPVELTTVELAAATGLTFRQVDYLCRHRHIPPRCYHWLGTSHTRNPGGSGNRRRFPDWLIEPLTVYRRIGDALPAGTTHNPTALCEQLIDHFDGNLDPYPITLTLAANITLIVSDDEP